MRRFPPVLWIHGDREHPGTLRCERWLSREAPAEAHPLRASPGLTLPFRSGDVHAVVISEVLERLDTATTLRLFLESHRLLAEEGCLVLDLMDAEAVLRGWRSGDASAVPGLEEAPSPGEAGAWAARGVPDTRDFRMAALFCTYRGGRVPTYHGPPAVDPARLRWMRDRWTPFRLATDLRHAVVDSEPRFHFERQSAWGRDELARELRRVGFEVRSFEPADTAAVLAGLPMEAPPGPERMRCMARPLPFHLDSTRAPHAYRLLWERFGRAMRKEAASRGRGAPDADFARLGYREGRLSEEAMARFARALEQATPQALLMEDHAPGHAFNDALSPESVAGINRSQTFLRLEAPQRAALAPLLEELAEPVSACLGTGFRIVNTRCWKTAAEAAREETNGWHTDELYPAEVLKVMLYVTPAGASTGTTELVMDDGSRVMAEGPPGTYLLFKNLERIHRGVPPREGSRLIVELTLAPWLENDLRPRCAGLNAEFPLVPWAPLEERA